jgi:tetratricopeptide (TPR) repeat protein
MLVAATLSYSTGEMQQAQKLYSRYLAKFPKRLYARKMLAAAWLRSDQPQSALYVLQPILEGSNDSQALALAGEAYLQLGQSEKAVPFLERSVALDPGDSGKLASLGASRLIAGDTARALSALEAAVNLDPGNIRATNLLIMTMIGRNELDKAMQAALALEKSAPNNPLSYSLKARSILQSVILPAPASAWNTRLVCNRHIFLQPLHWLRSIWLPTSRTQRANALRRYWTRTRPTSMPWSLAGISLGEGQRDEAVRWLKRAVSDHPQAVQPRVLAQLYLQANQPAEALEAAQTARGKVYRIRSWVLGAAQLATNDNVGAIQLSRPLSRRCRDQFLHVLNWRRLTRQMATIRQRQRWRKKR